MPKAAAIHPDEIDAPGVPPAASAAPTVPPRVEPFEAPSTVAASDEASARGPDLEARKQQLRELVAAHPLASLGATLAIGASLGILLKRLR